MAGKHPFRPGRHHGISHRDRQEPLEPTHPLDFAHLRHYAVAELGVQRLERLELAGRSRWQCWLGRHRSGRSQQYDWPDTPDFTPQAGVS